MDSQSFDQLTRGLARPTSRRRVVKGMAIALGAAVGSFLGVGGASADRKVGVCHRTGSGTNPFVYITVSESAAQAHAAHGDDVDVDLNSDVNNCGACGVSCADGEVCTDGACVATCTADNGTCAGNDDCCSGVCTCGPNDEAGHCQLPFFQGFETDIDGWDEAPSPVRVASGTHSIVSKAGSFNAEAGQFDLDHDGGSAFTRWGGYSSVFPSGGYTTSVDIYLDVTLNASVGTDVRFDWISAISTPACAHRRDFVFNAGTDPLVAGQFIISAGNNAGRGSSFPSNPGHDPYTIAISGWYTFEHRFYDSGGGVLAVDMTIRDSAGIAIKTWTLSDATDLIGVTVGGNRYGWFASQEFPFLSFDNSSRG